MIARRLPAASCAGFSLVELMVATVISMVAVIAMLQSLSMFEGPRRTAVGAADLQTNGSLALYTVDRDLRMAGYGLALPAVLGCTINSSYNGQSPAAPSPLAPPFKLAPLVITKGVNGRSDTVQILSSAKRHSSVPARVVTDHPPQAANFFLNSVLGIEVTDMMIAFEAGKDCSLFQVTSIPGNGGAGGNGQIHHDSAKSPWNPPGGQNIFPPGGYSTNALLFNLGSLSVRTYSVDAGNSFQLLTYTSMDNSSSVQQLYSDIVAMKARYGFDTRPTAAAVDTRIDTWSDTMIDADGNGITGDSGDIQRIYAAHIAIVGRSAAIEKPGTNGSCTYYSGTPAVLKSPVSTITNPASGIVTTYPIDVSKNPDGTANLAWQCYRYKVFESVVPLRNLIWGKL